MRKLATMLVVTGVLVSSICALEQSEELKQAAEAGVAKAQLELGNGYAKGLGVPQSDGLALEWTQKAAEQYYAPAMFALGKIFEEGRLGQEKDPGMAVLWVRRAAGQELSVALYTLGTYYQQGIGVEVDMKKAAEWHLRAAMLGDESSQLLIARNFDQWSCYVLNKRSAFACLEQVAEQGDAESQCNLGAYYAKRGADDADLEAAVKWLRLSSAQGNAEATKLLAYHYLKGLGVEKNPEEAIQFYMIAAKKMGDNESLETIGRLYSGVDGIEKDLEFSSAWYVLAAKTGRRTSQIRCIQIYANGIGVEPSPAEAYAWALVVAGDGDSDYKQKIETELSVIEQTKGYKRYRALLLEMRKMKDSGSS